MTRTRTAVATFVAILAFAFQPAAFAQTVAGSAAVLEVQRLAPQLLSFAGTPSNFASLVNGLASGAPVTLTTALADGRIETATFTPVGALSSVEIAQTLELARQDLIRRGIGAPTAGQIGVSLVGGSLAAPAGSAPVAGVLAQGTAASVPSATAGGSAAIVPERPRVAVTTSPAGTTVPIADAPTAVPSATVAPAAASPGVEGASVGTSATPAPRFTSDSPLFGTSDSPTVGTGATATSPNGPPSPAVQIQNRR